jgi:hypothetical protein
LYYAIEWDGGSDGVFWSVYTQMTMDTYFANIAGLTSGQAYQFRYKAQNIYGWSDPSAEISVTTMSLPSAANVPVTEVDGLNVKITWDKPYSGGANVPILYY